MKLSLEYAEATNEQPLRAYWGAFCDADPVPPEFADDMEAAGLIQSRPTTKADVSGDMFWGAKYGDWVPDSLWELTEAGRAALKDTTQSDDLWLVAKLQPAWVLDEPLGKAVSILQHQHPELADAVGAFIVANNALKSEAATAIERLVAERDEAREALKPFAEFAEHWDGKAVEYLRETQGKASDRLSDAEIAAIHTPDDEVRLDTGEMRRTGQKTITMADFRRARQALKGAP